MSLPKFKIRRLPFLVVQEHPDDYASITLDCPENVDRYWHEHIASAMDHDPTKELLAVVLLSSRLKPLGWNRVSVGNLNETVAHPREILRPAIIASAHSILIVHNHPSGNPAPSASDKQMTDRLKKTCELMQIPLIDSMIIGFKSPCHDKFFSFREAGMI